MRKTNLTVVIILMLALFSIRNMNGQSVPTTKVEFLNAPVLFKEGGKSYQQVVASCNSEITGKIVFTRNGKDLLKETVEKGDNKYLLTFPAVTKPNKIVITVKINDGTSEKYPFTLVPPKKWGVDFVQHSHTDIGYTRPQSEILAEHLRFIDYALDYCDQTDNMPDDAK